MKRSKILCTFLLSGLISIANSPYISKVYDFVPAPGQFTNIYPEYEDGDTYDTMLAKVSETLVGDATPGLITLGGYGGYVIFGFDHTVVNVAGEYDFRVNGNAFVGNAEPGIIMVSRDTNGDGLPNDEWYEIAGSEYYKDTTIKGYEITYSKPSSDNDNVKWQSNNNETGEIEKNMFHKQPYYPKWISDNSIIFKGTKLPANGKYENNKYVLSAYDWGYADNQPNTADESRINIDWAVNSAGEHVNLEGVDFIKVYTAINKSLPQIGETSTEVTGAEDLHPSAAVNAIDINNSSVYFCSNVVDNILTMINNADKSQYNIYLTTGAEVMTFTLEEGVNSISVDNLQSGIYIVSDGKNIFKFIKR